MLITYMSFSRILGDAYARRNSVILCSMIRTCHVHLLGIVPYEDAWELQNRLAGEISAGIQQPTLLLLEHPHTYTFGRSGNADNMLWDEATLARKNISVHWVDRGGDVTYHGPGQLVGYPLIPLGTPNLQVEQRRDSAHLPKADYIEYLRKLEVTLITALANLGVTAEQSPGLTGVWIQLPPPTQSGDESLMASQLPSKIASIGVKVDARGVSRHGFALNVNPDMSYWEGIIGCGLEDYQETSLAELLSPPPTVESVMQGVIAAFGEEFDYTMQIKSL
ncbi:MAG: lipoyl(octanoyl) transferase LipB [Anaerolineales bacterium]